MVECALKISYLSLFREGSHVLAISAPHLSCSSILKEGVYLYLPFLQVTYLKREGSSVLTVSAGYVSVLKERVHLYLPFLQVICRS